MTQQLKMVNLKCPNCAGALEISGDMERFACGYCGSEQIVERRGGTIGLRLVDAVERIQAGTDKTAAELALVRLDKELASARTQWEKADRLFGFRNEPNNSWVFFVTTISVFAGLIGLGGLLVQVGAGASGKSDIGLVFLSILFIGGAVGGVVCALKLPAIATKRYLAGRSELWIPYDKQIQLVEKQIWKQRQLIHS